MATIAVKAANTPVPVLGSILDGFMNRIDQSIQHTINSATSGLLTMEVEAGRQVAIAIQNAKEAYADSLNLTVDKVSSAITAKIDQFSNMVQIVQDNNKEFLGKAAADAQQLVNTLPFSKQQPQLTTIAPQYVAISSQADTVLIKFAGNFPWSVDKRYPTSFTMNNQACPIFLNTTQSLLYKVPVAAIPNTAMDKCTYAMGKLQVLWSNGWVWPFERTHTAEYNVGLAVLPLSPGNITAFFASSSMNRVEKTYTSPTYRYDGNNWFPQAWVYHKLCVPPEAGWRLDTHVQPKLVLHPGAHGNHTQEICSFDENGVQVAIGLQANNGHNMGIVEFHLVFSEYQMVPETNTRQEPMVFKWGDSKILQPNAGETIWKIAFDCFDGSYNEFSPADTGNKYLKLVNENGTIRLIAQVPDQLGVSGIDIYSEHKNRAIDSALQKKTTEEKPKDIDLQQPHWPQADAIDRIVASDLAARQG